MSKRSPTDGEVADETGLSADRRTFMETLGVGATGLFGSQYASTATASKDDMEIFEFSGDQLVLGGTRVVGEGGYPTISQAWNDAESGDTIYVHSSYDAQAVGEPFPIELDYEKKEVMLTGGHPSGSVIDASHTDENVIEVLGRGMNDYRNNPVVQNLKIVGGDVGLRIRAAPFASFENLVFYKTGGDGVRIDPYTDPDSGRSKGTFGATFSNCQAWSCGGDGFRTATDAYPHDTTFANCKATSNRGVGFRLRGYTCKIIGGTVQLNHSYGVEARYGKSMLIQNTYIEGNSRSESYPVDVYAKRADGLTISNCYFHGKTSRSKTYDSEYVKRGVNIHNSSKVCIRDCSVRNYSEGFLALFDCLDPDVHAGSHYLLDASRGLFAVDPIRHGNERPRSDGIIMPMDLSDVEPLHDCDIGYHVGSDVEGMAYWRDGEWRVAETTGI